ncbi:dienelactone hydrolase family protein [Nocardia vinacea]|uniref:Dienelactone hydrolase family protein n=1 Tax=Nocardia vinacea TaxID=96468 RepID=A0ABZ1Z5D4_9NOCA|nr:dienelactone hydrolase family protein [Nocardia vinacea]
MSVIDAVVSAAAILFAMVAAVFPRRVAYALPVALPLLIFGCLVQFVLEDFYWQMVPCYLAIVAATLLVSSRLRRAEPAVTEWTRKRRVLAVLAPVAVGLLAVLAILPWSIPPVPTLPEPTGRYRIGSEIFRWIDEQRPETSTDSTADRRNVIVQAWYPTDVESARQWVYIDGQARLPGRVTQIPGFVMHSYGRIDTHAYADVPISAERARWPVVLFSPGYGAPRAFYTGLVTDLASRGFVVLAIDHPYEVAVTELADGSVATPTDDFPENDADGERYMSEHLQVRRDDLRFVLDQLDRPDAIGALSGRLDTDHIAAIGHSFGGASAVAAAADEPRIEAVANIDGTLYGELPALNQPFLLVESDHSETGHSAQYLDRNRDLIQHLQATGFRYEIAEANHFGFTDVPLFLAAPARFAVAQFIGGARGPVDTQRAANDILVAFLQNGDIQAAAAGHPNIHGGPVP